MLGLTSKQHMYMHGWVGSATLPRSVKPFQSRLLHKPNGKGLWPAVIGDCDGQTKLAMTSFRENKTPSRVAEVQWL
jgi:hypothetical protein